MMNVYKLKKYIKGNIGIGLISGITALSFTGVAIQIGYTGFKQKAEKQLHILNSIRFATIVQIGIEEGWVNLPDSNGTTEIKLIDINTSTPVNIQLKNPSLLTETYDDDSAIIIENNNGTLEYYCNLLEDGTNHNYINSDIDVYNLTPENIELNLN